MDSGIYDSDRCSTDCHRSNLPTKYLKPSRWNVVFVKPMELVTLDLFIDEEYLFSY